MVGRVASGGGVLAHAVPRHLSRKGGHQRLEAAAKAAKEAKKEESKTEEVLKEGSESAADAAAASAPQEVAKVQEEQGPAEQSNENVAREEGAMNIFHEHLAGIRQYPFKMMKVLLLRN